MLKGCSKWKQNESNAMKMKQFRSMCNATVSNYNKKYNTKNFVIAIGVIS